MLRTPIECVTDIVEPRSRVIIAEKFSYRADKYSGRFFAPEGFFETVPPETRNEWIKFISMRNEKRRIMGIGRVAEIAFPQSSIG